MSTPSASPAANPSHSKKSLSTENASNANSEMCVIKTLSHDDIMEIFGEYLDLREQEIINEPFVAPAAAHREHPYSEKFRLDIINWMYEVSRDAFVQNLILHHSIHLLDATAPYIMMDSADGGYPVVQLIAICSINTMQKIHADFSDLFQQIQTSVEGEFTLEMCEYLEAAIQKIARPNVRRPTVMGFGRLYCRICPVSRRTGWLMTYLADLVLVHGRHLHRVRYCIAAVAVYVIAVGTINQRDDTSVDPWPFDLAKFSRIDFDGQTGELLVELVHDIYQLQSDFAVSEQGLLPSEFLKKYRSVNCLGVASYAVMDRPFLTATLDALKIAAADRRQVVRSSCNEPSNLFIRSEPRGPHPSWSAIDRTSSLSKGRYFSNPANSQQSTPKKQKISDPELDEFDF